MSFPFVRAALGAAAACLVLACSPAAESPTESAALEGETVLAEANGEKITVAEVDAWIKDLLLRQATRDGDPARLYDVRSRALDQMIQDRLVAAEAKSRGVDSQALLDEEARARSSVDDKEVEDYYQSNRNRYEGSSFEEAAPRIREQLERQRRDGAVREYVAALREAAGVSIHLERPRTTVAAEGPTRGPEDAPVTIIEFSDYQCPFCRRAEPTVQQLLERYPDQIRFVYRHFPLESIHPRARPAAEAAACAGEQGKFWEYHDAIFKDPSKLADEDLHRNAADAGLDAEAFRACFEEGRFRDAIDADLAAGREAGVSGTPAFFVNGIPLSGARPLDDFVQLVESELERAGSQTDS